MTNSPTVCDDQRRRRRADQACVSLLLVSVIGALSFHAATISNPERCERAVRRSLQQPEESPVPLKRVSVQARPSGTTVEFDRWTGGPVECRARLFGGTPRVIFKPEAPQANLN